jgi:hypothetical protein
MRITIALLAVLGIAALAQGAPRRLAEIEGRVVDQGTGQALEGLANVYLFSEGRCIGSVRTDGAGGFLFRVPVGTYSVSVYSGERWLGTGDVTFGAGRQLHVIYAPPVELEFEPMVVEVEVKKNRALARR